MQLIYDFLVMPISTVFAELLFLLNKINASTINPIIITPQVTPKAIPITASVLRLVSTIFRKIMMI